MKQPYVIKSPAQKTDEELVATVGALVEVISYDLVHGRDIWSATAALHSHTEEQRTRHYARRAAAEAMYPKL